jgi:hypothetical protein
MPKFAGYRLVKERVPYEGKGIDNLLATLKVLLVANPYTHKLTVEVGTKEIRLQKFVPEEGHSGELTWHEAVRSVPMYEYAPDREGMLPLHQYWAAILRLQMEGFELGRVMVGDKAKFQKWLGLIIPTVKPTVLGVPMEVDTALPEDVFILCGVLDFDCEPVDVECSVKGVIP